MDCWRSGTLCWCCRNAYNGCDWSRDGKPVEGWTAVRNDVQPNCDGGDVSYIVFRCPLFQLEERFGEEYRRFQKKIRPFLKEVLP